MRGDLDAVDALIEGMRGASAVFHAAASLGDSGTLEEFTRGNVHGTAHVVHAAREAGVPVLVHVSTEAVLATGAPLVNVDETVPRPIDACRPYGLTKGQAEAIVQASGTPALRTSVVRPRLVWGRGDTTLLPRLSDAVRKGQFAWFDGGRYLTSTTHVENVVEGLLAAEERGGPGEIYFVTDGPPVEFRAFVTQLLETQGVAPPTRSIPLPVARALAGGAEAAWGALPLGGAPPVTRQALALIGVEMTVNDAKARRELRYTAHKTREDGLAELGEDHAARGVGRGSGG